MTKQQFDELYLGKVVHCDTVEKANKFLELAHRFEYEWVTDGSGYPIVKFELEKETPKEKKKENKMKYKVGDKVRVRSDLVVGKLYGDREFSLHAQHRRGLTFKIIRTEGSYYGLDIGGGFIQNGYTDEMLEPVEEFNVGDVVYDDGGQRLEVIGFGVKVRTKNRVEFYKPSEQLSKTKPLQKITRKELAEKGYELVE